MYSGATVLFAVEITRSELCRILQINEDDWNDYELASADIVQGLLKYKCTTIGVFKMPCCHGADNPVFLGIRLGDMLVAYRDRIVTFDNFSAYEQHLQSMINTMKFQARKIDNATRDLHKIVPDKIPKIVTFADDCSSCT